MISIELDCSDSDTAYEKFLDIIFTVAVTHVQMIPKRESNVDMLDYDSKWQEDYDDYDDDGNEYGEDYDNDDEEYDY